MKNACYLSDLWVYSLIRTCTRERANLPTRLWKDLCYECLSTDTLKNSVCVTSGQDLCHRTFQYDLSARLVLRGLLCDRRGSFNTNLCTQEPQKSSSPSFFARQAQGFSAALAMGTLRALEHFPRFWSRKMRHLLQKTQRRLCESSAATKASCPGTVREPALSQWTWTSRKQFRVSQPTGNPRGDRASSSYDPRLFFLTLLRLLASVSFLF